MMDKHASDANRFGRYLAGVSTLIIAETEGVGKTSVVKRVVKFAGALAEADGIEPPKTATEIFDHKDLWRRRLIAYWRGRTIGVAV